jgi:hypothetical protein
MPESTYGPYLRPLASSGLARIRFAAMSTRSALTDRATTELAGVRRHLARLVEGDETRDALEARAAELGVLLDDLEHGLLSARVLAATAELRTGPAEPWAAAFRAAAAAPSVGQWDRGQPIPSPGPVPRPLAVQPPRLSRFRLRPSDVR